MEKFSNIRKLGLFTILAAPSECLDAGCPGCAELIDVAQDIEEAVYLKKEYAAAYGEAFDVWIEWT